MWLAKVYFVLDYNLHCVDKYGRFIYELLPVSVERGN